MLISAVSSFCTTPVPLVSKNLPEAILLFVSVAASVTLLFPNINFPFVKVTELLNLAAPVIFAFATLSNTRFDTANPFIFIFCIADPFKDNVPTPVISELLVTSPCTTTSPPD